MAEGVLVNNLKVYIIDSCYLVELFKIPGHFQEDFHDKIKFKFETAINNKSILVVPFPCIFELANHIAHIDNGSKRYELSQKLYKTVEMSLNHSVPWIIPPYSGINDVLKDICKLFSDVYSSHGIGLTDTYIIREANFWKSKYNSRYKIHIWTKDASVKSYEPDIEHDSVLS